MDIFVDETKTRYKGTIVLDKEIQPVIVVKTPEVAKRSSLQNSYIMLKVGKNTYHFSAESYKELKQWSALIRQVIDYGKRACIVFLMLAKSRVYFTFRSS